MIDQIRELLNSGRVDVFLAYRLVEGHPLPHAFTGRNLDALGELVTGPARYPLEKIAARLAGMEPGIRIGMLARDCNRRAANVLILWNQLPPDAIVQVDLNCCPSGLTEQADCTYLTPGKTGLFKKQVGIDPALTTRESAAVEPRERFNRWMYEFQKCIKCYGCRDICPVCFCSECSLEHADLIRTGGLPPEVPIFHLVRAVHMAGRCIDCGLCEEACPAEIPLRLLYRKVNEVTAELFDYRPGVSQGPSPLQVLGDRTELTPKPVEAA
jgi:ferredoxin